jgi:hypothetical protein
MWNSNSMVAWLLASAGVNTEDVRPPPGGRAPGWDAGLVVARRRAPHAGDAAGRLDRLVTDQSLTASSTGAGRGESAVARRARRVEAARGRRT